MGRFIHDNFDRIIGAASNDTVEGGSLKIIDNLSATAPATPSTEAAQSTVAIPQSSWKLWLLYFNTISADLAVIQVSESYS